LHGQSTDTKEVVSIKAASKERRIFMKANVNKATQMDGYVKVHREVLEK
jgi:hypothetical protein